MARTWRSRLAAAALGLLTVVTGTMEPGRDAAAQTVEGDLRIVRRIPLERGVDIAWSPDGRHLATSLGDDGYLVLDAESGRTVRSLSGAEYGNRVNTGTVAFTPDGNHLIVRPALSPRRDDDTYVAIALWNLATGAIDKTITGPSLVENYAVAPQANRIAILYGGDTVVLYDTRSWEAISSWKPRVGAGIALSTTSLALDPSGRLVAMGGQVRGSYRGQPRGVIYVYDAVTGALVSSILEAHTNSVDYLAFVGTTGRLASAAQQQSAVLNLATGQPGTAIDHDPVRIWDIRTARKVHSFELQVNNPNSLVTSGDGRLLGFAGGGTERTGGYPAEYRIWNLATGLEVGKLIGMRTYFSDSLFAPSAHTLAIRHARLGGGGFEVLIVAVE